MKQHHGAASPLGVAKLLIQRFAFLALIMAAFGLMMIGKADTVLVERMRATVSDAVTPILDVMARPAASIADFFANVRDLSNLRAENTRLRTENAHLLEWQTTARRLDAENRSLKELLNFKAEGEISYVSSRVVADAGGAFVRGLLINAGTRDGIGKGQAAVTGEGLVGRVAEVGGRSARILLITDINSRIPVLVESTRAKAIMAGDNSHRPRLQFLTSNAGIQPGDRIVTSGSAAAFPPGLPVGVAVESGDGIRVEPFVDPAMVEYVRIVDYGLKGIIDTDDAARAPDKAAPADVPPPPEDAAAAQQEPMPQDAPPQPQDPGGRQ